MSQIFKNAQKLMTFENLVKNIDYFLCVIITLDRRYIQRTVGYKMLFHAIQTEIF